jgi:hypothetical protein
MKRPQHWTNAENECHLQQLSTAVGQVKQTAKIDMRGPLRDGPVI